MYKIIQKSQNGDIVTLLEEGKDSPIDQKLCQVQTTSQSFVKRMAEGTMVEASIVQSNNVNHLKYIKEIKVDALPSIPNPSTAPLATIGSDTTKSKVEPWILEQERKNKLSILSSVAVIVASMGCTLETPTQTIIDIVGKLYEGLKMKINNPVDNVQEVKAVKVDALPSLGKAETKVTEEEPFEVIDPDTNQPVQIIT